MEPTDAISSFFDPGPMLLVLPPVALLLAFGVLLGTMIWQAVNGGRHDSTGHTVPQDIQVATVRRVWLTATIAMLALVSLSFVMWAIVRVVY